jgi:hypothetical protein
VRVSTQCCFSASIETSGVSWKLSGPSPPLDEGFTSLSKGRGSGGARGMVSSSSHKSSCTTMTYGEFAPQESARLLVAFLARSFQWMRPFDNLSLSAGRLVCGQVKLSGGAGKKFESGRAHLYGDPR